MTAFIDPHRYTRRALLKTFGLSPAFVPLLQTTTSYAATPASPRRLLTVMYPNGCRSASYWPKGGGDSFQIDPEGELAPLIPHQKDLIVVGGLRSQAAVDLGFEGHEATECLLTGKGKPSGGWVIGGGISVDQYVANAFAKTDPTPFASIVTRVPSIGNRPGGGFVSYSGDPIGDTPQIVRSYDDVYQLFDALFGQSKVGSSGMADPQLAQLRARRQSVFDFVGAQLKSLKTRVGSDDRQKIDRHAEAIRSVEQQLDAVRTCMAPSAPAGSDARTEAGSQTWHKFLRAQSDLVITAMRCNLTRVASLMWGSDANIGTVFYWLGSDFLTDITSPTQNGGQAGLRHHHEFAHNADSDPAGARLQIIADRWFVSEWAHIIEEMKATPEGAGTMLDKSAVLMINNMADGNHSVDGLPCVIAGSADGYFKTGRYVKLGNFGKVDFNKGTQWVPHNGVLVALANAMLNGTQPALTSFGDPKYGGEPPGLRG